MRVVVAFLLTEMGERRVKRIYPTHLRNGDRNKDELASCGKLYSPLAK